MTRSLANVGIGGPLRLRWRGMAGGPLLPAATTAAAAPSLGPPCCRATQTRALSLWTALRPWASKQKPQEPQDEQQPQQQLQQQQQQQTVSAEAARAAKEASAASAAAARPGKEKETPGVIPSRFAGAAEGPPSQVKAGGAPPTKRAWEGPPARVSSGETLRRGPRKGAPPKRLNGALWRPPGEAWAPLSSADFLQEVQQIFDAASEMRPEPRRPQGAPICRSVRKPLGPLLTRLSKSPLFLRAAVPSPAAITAASAAAASTPAPQEQQQEQQQQRQQQQEQQQALFSRALDFAYRSGFTVVCGGPQRLLATGGVRVLHPSRTRGAPDPKPPDLTNDQFCFFARDLGL
ncbi:hypothetical protein Emag_003369 [Eimeria magna]